MKVTNWRRTLAATLVAGGMLSPAAAQAANLDVNLVTNPGFEAVDPLLSTGAYDAPQILNWSGIGYAYSHNPTVTGIPDYADPTGPNIDPPSAGSWYFSSNNQPLAGTGDIREPDVFYQDIAVNAGATGTQISSGAAAVRYSAWMTSYFNDTDWGTVHLQFKNAAGATLSTASIEDPEKNSGNVWNQTRGVSFIPPTTATIRVSLFGTRTAGGGGGDGYIDNVDVQVTNAASALLFAEVNTVTGQVTIKNSTGQAVPIDYYELTSASNALNRASWNSLQDQNLPGFRAGTGTGDGWEEGGGGANGAISESNLTNVSFVSNNAALGLGAAYALGGAQDLEFRYGVVVNDVNSADFDIDGDVDGVDFLAWQRGLGKPADVTRADGDADGDPDGTPGPGDPPNQLADVDGADLAIWKNSFRPHSVLVQGFVRYVTSGAAAVPEPASAVVMGLGAGVILVGCRRSKRGDGG